MQTFLRITKVSILVQLFLLTCVTAAQAQSFGPGCQMSKDYKFNFFISPENNKSGMFGALVDRIPPTVVSNCKTANGKFLGFGLGLKQPYLSSDVSDISFDGVLRKEVCHIQDPPIKNLVSYDDRYTQFQKQFKLLRSCTYFELTHLDGKQIQFNEKQNYCELKKLPNGKVQAIGDFCYIRINSDLRVAISIIVKRDCLDQKFLSENNIEPTDLEALLQAFVVEDDSSLKTENMLGSTKVRLALMPDSKTIDVNQEVNIESPRFPTTFTTDIHQGPIIIKDGSFGDDKKTFFDISLFLDSRSDRNCRNGVCAGPGDYQMPVAGEVELFEVTADNKTKFLDSWYAGNPADPFAKAQWQGLFRFGRKVSEGLELEQGHEYEMRVSFYNPYDDYFMLIQGYQQILIDLTLMNGTAGKDFIQPLNSLRNLLGLPIIPVLPQVGSTDIEEQLEKVRQILARLSQDQTFPPYYLQACDFSRSSCQKMNSTSKYLTLKTFFKIDGVNESDNSYRLTNISTSRDSKFVPAYQRKVQALPSLVCE